MSWKELDLMSLREEFINFAIKPDATMAKLCRQYGISRKTGYKWVNRYKEQGKTGLANQSRRPTSSPFSLSSSALSEVLKTRERFPSWGGRKIHAYLSRQGLVNVPAPSTIQHHLKKLGLVNKQQPQRHYIRFEREEPNELWQMDFKGHFPYGEGRCHPLTVLDDHSRFSILLHGCKAERGITAKESLISAFKRYGMPKQINVDNGAPWGAANQCARYTEFSLWLIESGITVTYSAPHHPQTNGKIERFHRTLKNEVIIPNYFRDMEEIQQQLDAWRQTYNLERPHEALNYATPSDRYIPSYKEYTGQIPEHQYSEDYETVTTNCRGRITTDGRGIFIGIPFSKKDIGLRSIAGSRKLDIYYRHQMLGQIDLDEMPKKTVINLYSGAVLEC